MEAWGGSCCAPCFLNGTIDYHRARTCYRSLPHISYMAQGLMPTLEGFGGQGTNHHWPIPPTPQC